MTTIPSRIALITGGSRGLGRSTALHLARRGVHSIITYKSSRSEAEQVVQEARNLGSSMVACPLDLAKAGTFDAFVSAVRAALAELGGAGLDVLVNNAGTSLNQPFSATTEDQLDDVYRVHLKGVFFLTQKLLPLLNEGGRIVNVSSGLTRFTFPGYAGYAAMKGAVEVLTRYLARELGQRKITVNTVAPGAIATDFGGGHVRDNPELNRHLAAATALGRVGVADDIGPMIASLVTDDNRWVNGQRIEVSGGMNL